MNEQDQTVHKHRKAYDIIIVLHNIIKFIVSRVFQYIGGYKNVYIAPTLCFMLLDGAAIFREMTECRLNDFE